MNKIEFEHTIHEKRGHVSGSYPPEDTQRHNQIHQLAKAADAALHQQSGYFFDTLNMEIPIFTFGFLHLEKENRLEPFFDIYLTPIKRIEGVSLVDLKDQLAQNTKNINNRHDPISQKMTIDVSRTNTHTGRNGESSSQHGNQENFNREGQNDFAPSHDSRNPAPMSIEEIAEIWERYRRSDMKVPASFSDVNRFVTSVSGSIGKINYVSRVADRGDPFHFEFVGKTSSQDIDTSSLIDWLNNRYTAEELGWEDLPTYRDELQQLRSTMADDIRMSGNYSTISTDTTDWLEEIIQTEIAEYHHQRAVEVFNQNIDGKFTDTKEAGKLDQLRNLISLDESSYQYDAMAAAVQTQAIDENTKTKIAKELGEETHMELTKRLETRIIEELGQHLEDSIAEEVENILEETILKIDKVKTSKPYSESTLNE